MSKSVSLRLCVLIFLLLFETLLSTPTVTASNRLAGIEQVPLSPLASSPSSLAQYTVYLPIVRNGNAKFIGIIRRIYWNRENVESSMSQADFLAGQQHTAVGWFINVQDPAFWEDSETTWDNEYNLNKNNFYRQLEQLWLKGYVSMIKIGSTDTARSIADGKYDAELIRMAKIYKRWLQNGGGRKAMLAPLQEMNGYWVAYYPKNPDGTFVDSPAVRQQDFKEAYRHIVQAFEANGIDRSQVWWVFGPNGWSQPEDKFEYYYPGDDVVDLVGFASYNYGYCPATVQPNGDDYGKWENYDTLYAPYIQRMQVMAPTKPILITETGSSAVYTRQDREQGTFNYEKKAEWFLINYSYLAQQPAVLGVFYFDVDEFDGKQCDLNIPADFRGYQQALDNNSAFRYLTVTELDLYIP